MCHRNLILQAVCALLLSHVPRGRQLSTVLATAAGESGQKRSLILIGLSHLFLEPADDSCCRPNNPLTPKGCGKLLLAWGKQWKWGRVLEICTQYKQLDIDSSPLGAISSTGESFKCSPNPSTDIRCLDRSSVHRTGYITDQVSAIYYTLKTTASTTATICCSNHCCVGSVSS